MGSVPGVSAGGSPGTPKSQKDATTSPNPSHGFSAPCGALPPPHPALLCALGRGEAPPERLAWQLLWQPHIFLGIPNDLLAFAVIYSFFFFGCRRLTSLPSGPEERAHPVRCRSRGRAGGAAPVPPHLGTALWGAAGTGAPCPHLYRAGAKSQLPLSLGRLRGGQEGTATWGSETSGSCRSQRQQKAGNKGGPVQTGFVGALGCHSCLGFPSVPAGLLGFSLVKLNPERKN